MFYVGVLVSVKGDSIRYRNVRYTNEKFSLRDEFFNKFFNIILIVLGDD